MNNTAVNIESYPVNTQYSWELQEWWNINWSYSRVQYFSWELTNLDWFLRLVEEWDRYISETDNTRLDIRVALSDDFDISYIRKNFPDSDISVKRIWETKYLMFWLNIGERKLSEEKIQKVKNYVNCKVDKLLEYINKEWWFEQYAENILEIAKWRWLRFEKNNFEIQEIYDLWWENFWWTKDQISNFIETNAWRDVMFWLRDDSWLLIALIMIWDDYETTEWAVLEDFQNIWIIEPLLLVVNGLFIDKWEGEDIYAHMRWNRSIWPWIKSWLRINKQDETDNILTNLVEVKWEMTHFLEWTLDTNLFTKNLLEKIRDFRNFNY